MSASKQVIVMRRDLKMPRGKIAAQAAHASMAGVFRLMEQVNTDEWCSWTIDFHANSPVGQWLTGAFTKVCVAVDSEQQLSDVYEQAKAAGLNVSKIVDNGLTVFNGEPTWTCIAIGPCKSEHVDPITGGLKLMS